MMFFEIDQTAQLLSGLMGISAFIAITIITMITSGSLRRDLATIG
jgi:hypothetical protein